MYIYKITNKLNNKIYIGQVYNKTIYDRFERHIKEASPYSKSYLGRAISKYGKENFICELLDTASSLQELNQKEIYWITYYNSTNKNIGYNLTPGGDGGNTYLCKTIKEIQKIKEKISKANKGINNGQAKQLKAFNVNTKEIIHFDTLSDACKYFNHKQKGTFINHCEHKAICLWRKEWTFAYENEEFKYDLPIEYDKSCNNGKKIKLIDIKTNDELIFNSLSKLRVYMNDKDFHVYRLQFNSNNECFYKNYKLIMLPKNFNNKCVSTIPDECKGVGLEISTNSKQEAIDS